MRFAVFELLQFKYFVDLPRLIFHGWESSLFLALPELSDLNHTKFGKATYRRFMNTLRFRL